MKFAKCMALAMLAVCIALPATAAEKKSKKKVSKALSFKMKSIDGKSVNLAKYQGKVLLVVNVASQ